MSRTARHLKANTLAELRGWTPFQGLQIEYSLAQRTVERELVPMAAGLGLTITAWSPLAGGRLARGEGPVNGALDLELSSDELATLDSASAVELGLPGDFLSSPGVRDVVYGSLRASIEHGM